MPRGGFAALDPSDLQPTSLPSLEPHVAGPDRARGFMMASAAVTVLGTVDDMEPRYPEVPAHASRSEAVAGFWAVLAPHLVDMGDSDEVCRAA